MKGKPFPYGSHLALLSAVAAGGLILAASWSLSGVGVDRFEIGRQSSEVELSTFAKRCHNCARVPVSGGGGTYPTSGAASTFTLGTGLTVNSSSATLSTSTSGSPVVTVCKTDGTPCDVRYSR